MKVYWIVFNPTGKYVGKRSPTYAVECDQRIAIDKQREIDENRRWRYYGEWIEGPWFVEDQAKAKLFNSLTHIRRALGSCRHIGLININFDRDSICADTALFRKDGELAQR